MPLMANIKKTGLDPCRCLLFLDEDAVFNLDHTELTVDYYRVFITRGTLEEMIGKYHTRAPKSWRPSSVYGFLWEMLDSKVDTYAGIMPFRIALDSLLEYESTFENPMDVMIQDLNLEFLPDEDLNPGMPIIASLRAGDVIADYLKRAHNGNCSLFDEEVLSSNACVEYLDRAKALSLAIRDGYRDALNRRFDSIRSLVSDLYREASSSLDAARRVCARYIADSISDQRFVNTALKTDVFGKDLVSIIVSKDPAMAEMITDLSFFHPNVKDCVRMVGYE